MSSGTTPVFDESFEFDILARCLRDKKFVRRTSRIAEEHHFGTPEARFAWEVIRATWRRYKEIPSPAAFRSALKRKYPSAEKRKPHAAFLKKLAGHAPTAPTVALDHLEEFVRAVELQEALEASAESLQKGDVDEAERLVRIKKSKRDRDYSHIRWIEGFEERQERRKYEAEHPDKFVVIPTGLKTLDRKLEGGARIGELCEVMGTTGRGKSIFLTNLAHCAGTKGHPTAYFGFEMPARQLAQRQDSRWSGKEYGSFKRWKFSAAELREIEAKLKRAKGRWENMLHIISMPVRSANIDSIYGALEDLQEEFDFCPELVILDSLDHLQAIDTKKESFRIQQAEVYWAGKALGEDGNYCVWTSVHAGREWAAKIATAEATAEAYDKARIADLVISLNDPNAARKKRGLRHRDGDEDASEEDDDVSIGGSATRAGFRRLEAFLAKYRDGESQLKIALDCDFARMRIREAKIPSSGTEEEEDDGRDR